MKNKLKEGYRSKIKKHTGTYEGTKVILKGRKPGLLLILIKSHAPGSGSTFSARIRIQDIQINPDPDTQHWLQLKNSATVLSSKWIIFSYAFNGARLFSHVTQQIFIAKYGLNLLSHHSLKSSCSGETLIFYSEAFLNFSGKALAFFFVFLKVKLSLYFLPYCCE
jgi:hypothetical protein